MRSCQKFVLHKRHQEFWPGLMDAEINMHVELLSRGYQEIGFCHNDLKYGVVLSIKVTGLVIRANGNNTKSIGFWVTLAKLLWYLINAMEPHFLASCTILSPSVGLDLVNCMVFLPFV
ncbi:hypothetical protein VNO78_33071 [Psophocarpus tetragonolobus]|uniref:Uncharacterized protein n=1 Tax=Psophocarpus tetragonolobus TaxID=3891 RepID=A0AAN9P3H6_PSOTE